MSVVSESQVDGSEFTVMNSPGSHTPKPVPVRVDAEPTTCPTMAHGNRHPDAARRTSNMPMAQADAADGRSRSRFDSHRGTRHRPTTCGMAATVGRRRPARAGGIDAPARHRRPMSADGDCRLPASASGTAAGQVAEPVVQPVGATRLARPTTPRAGDAPAMSGRQRRDQAQHVLRPSTRRRRSRPPRRSAVFQRSMPSLDMPAARSRSSVAPLVRARHHRAGRSAGRWLPYSNVTSIGQPLGKPGGQVADHGPADGRALAGQRALAFEHLDHDRPLVLASW